jgi:hypothetical protein
MSSSFAELRDRVSCLPPTQSDIISVPDMSKRAHSDRLGITVPVTVVLQSCCKDGQCHANLEVIPKVVPEI